MFKYSCAILLFFVLFFTRLHAQDWEKDVKDPSNFFNLQKAYFENEIMPHIDGEQIQYAGALNDVQKNELLGSAKALLFPIEWAEPFGIVMVEAMACGTPVIAFSRGSVTEVIDEAVTGFKVDTENEMIDAVKIVSNLSRAQCRQKAMERFDAVVIAKQYLGFVNSESKPLEQCVTVIND